MSKLRVIFVISLVIFGVLLVRVFFWPMVSGEKYSEVSRESIIQSDGEWIIEFDCCLTNTDRGNRLMLWVSSRR